MMNHRPHLIIATTLIPNSYPMHIRTASSHPTQLLWQVDTCNGAGLVEVTLDECVKAVVIATKPNTLIFS